MKTIVIGVDCATEEAKVGLAHGYSDGRDLWIGGTAECTAETSAATHAAKWVRAAVGPVLLAIDAPLGWPVAFGPTLASHNAGEAILVSPNELFRRDTDRFVKRHLGQQPLDVGADRIARTAHAALRFLGELRALTGLPIPLAWNPGLEVSVSAIEVYPAATLMSHGFPSKGYKKPEQTEKRKEILRRLEEVATLPADRAQMERNADALDACVCLLSAHDFLRGEAYPPQNLALAKKESWIWARARSHG